MAALALCAFVSLPVMPAHADRGVAVGPYWQQNVEGNLTALAVDDLDGDGWAEIVVGTDEGQVIAWRAEGEPAWAFAVESDWVTGLTIADLDLDGKQEVFVIASGILPTSYLYVLRADGNLAWSYSVRDEIWGVHLLNLDDDGANEVLLAARNPTILDDDGSQFTGWPVAVLGTPYVRTSDVDGDGLDDVVALDSTDVTIVATSGASRSWPHGLEDTILGFEVSDLDGDGKGEVGVASGETVTIFRADGTTAWAVSVKESPVAGWMGDPPGVLLGTAGAVSWLSPGGTEAWRFPVVLPQAPGIYSLHAADPGADGSPEVAFGTATGQVYLLGGMGQPLAEYTTAGAATLVRYLDLNGDGLGEVVVGAGSTLSVFGSPAGPTTIRLRWTYTIRGAVTELCAADLDLDGQQEIAFGGQDKKVTLLDGEGTMVWQFPAAGSIGGVSIIPDPAGGPGQVLARAGDRLYLLSHEGTPLWQRTFPSAVTAAAGGAGPGAVIALGLEDGTVSLLALADGAEAWSHPFGRAVRAVAITSALPGVVAGLGDGRVVRLDDRGQVLWQYDAGRVVTWLSIADLDHNGRDDLLVRSGDSVFRLQLEDGQRVWQSDTQAERLIGVVSGDGIALGTDQHAYLLDASGEEVWAHALDQVASAVHSADIAGACEANASGCEGSEVVVGTVEGRIYLLGSDGQILWQENERERVNVIQAADLNGDGGQELLVGLEDGEVQAYGLAVNQVPWLSAPDLVLVGDGYAYSVRVLDPEGDQVGITLEIWDPSAQDWITQEKNIALGGQGSVSWNLPNPFDTWDAGRDSRFRFTWDDGQTSATVTPVPGPLDISVMPWYLHYGRYLLAMIVIGAIPALLLVLFVRTRTYRRSPVGRAEAFLLRLTLEPEEMLPELHRLTTDEARMTAILPHLPGLARQEGEEMVAGLAEGYYLIISRPDAARVSEGVRSLDAALAEQDRVPPAAWRRESQQVYGLMLAALEAHTVEQIVALGESMRSMTDLVEGSRFFLGEAARLLLQLGQVCHTLASLDRVESIADQIAYLAEAMESLGRCDLAARSSLAGPEQVVVIHIVANWLAVVTRSLTALQGRAQLELTLKTRKAITAAADVVLALALDNIGRSPASNLTVELLPGTGYKVHDGRFEMAVLPAGRTADVELRARPESGIETFRVEFRITYDDRERTGKTDLFADRVRLVSPPAEFRPISNPYATGKPLQAGSPVFVGREDLFAFVRENLAGPAGENVLILVGDRRMGKTSVLRQLPLRLPDGFVPIFIDGQAIGMEPGMANLLYDIGLEVQQGLAAHGITVSLPPLDAFQARPVDSFERQFLAGVQSALRDQTLLLLLDEYEELEARVRSGDLEEKVFSYLRHLMQHLENVGFVFAGGHRLEELTADYWSILFNIALYRRVGLLDEVAARCLISEPVADAGLLYDDLAVDKMLKATAGHPYFLQLLCHTLVNILNQERIAYVTVGDVNRALEEMLNLGEAHLAYLWERAAPWEQAVLAALARLISSGEPGSAGAVTSLLADYGLAVDPVAVSEALHRLAVRGPLRPAGAGSARYEFEVDLVRLWIDRCKSLARAVDATRSNTPQS